MGRWLLLVVLASPLAFGQQAQPPREYIYGAELMTPQERQEYREAARAAGSEMERAQVRERQRQRLRERARQRGVTLSEPQGIVQKQAK